LRASGRQNRDAPPIHACFGITAAEASGDFLQEPWAHDPLEGLTAVEERPNPASVEESEPVRASVETVHSKDPPAGLLETNPANAAV